MDHSITGLIDCPSAHVDMDARAGACTGVAVLSTAAAALATVQP